MWPADHNWSPRKYILMLCKRHACSPCAGLGRKVCNGILKLIVPQPKMFLGADGLPLPEIPPLVPDTKMRTLPPGGSKKRDEGPPLCQQGHHFIEV